MASVSSSSTTATASAVSAANARPPPPPFYFDEKWKLSKKEASSRSRSSTCPLMKNSSSSSSRRRCSFTRKCARLVKEQRARFYIVRRCVTMLICWRDYSDSWKLKDFERERKSWGSTETEREKFLCFFCLSFAFIWSILDLFWGLLENPVFSFTKSEERGKGKRKIDI